MQTVIALYETQAVAQDAANALVSAGVPRDDIRIEQHDTMESARHADQPQRSFWDWLFGRESQIPDYDAHIYAESLRRGDYALVVDTENADTTTITNIMERYEPIDMNARGTYFQSGGWRGYDVSQPNYTADEIESDRLRYRSAFDTTTRSHDAERAPEGSRVRWYQQDTTDSVPENSWGAVEDNPMDDEIVETSSLDDTHRRR